jgi:hypothetical protein
MLIRRLVAVNAGKTKCMLLYRHQNAGQNHDVKIANRSFENVAQFRYMGTTVTYQNLFQEEIKRRLDSGNICYHTVQKLLSSRLLSKNIKIRKYKIIILPVVLYGSVTLMEEHKLREFDNRVLRRTFGPKRDEVTGGLRKQHNKELYNLYSSPSIIRVIRRRRMRWARHVAQMGLRGMHIGYWWESQKERER